MMSKVMSKWTANQGRIYTEYKGYVKLGKDGKQGKLNYTGIRIIEELEVGAKTVVELMAALGCVAKTIRYWTEDKLEEIIGKIPNLNDMRSGFYTLRR